MPLAKVLSSGTHRTAHLAPFAARANRPIADDPKRVGAKVAIVPAHADGLDRHETRTG